MRWMNGCLSLICVAGLCEDPQGPEHQKWVQLKGVYLVHGDQNCLENARGYGAGLGKWFTHRWGGEVDYLDTQLKYCVTGLSSYEKHLMGSALFNFNPQGARWQPYLRAGLGAVRVEAPFSLEPHAVTAFTYHGGLGVQRFFRTHGIASLEARAISVETRARRTEYMGLLGVGMRWGAQERTPIPAPPVMAPPEPPPPPAPEPPPPPPPAPVVVPPPPPPPPPPAPPAKVVLDDALLHFANNGTAISPEGRQAIGTVARSLKVYPGDYDVKVSGHTSSTGGRAHNRVLSLKRADAVAQVLVAEGIPAARVKTLGMGPDQPLADNATREGQAKNRRVEIDIQVRDAQVETREVKTDLVGVETSRDLKATKPRRKKPTK